MSKGLKVFLTLLCFVFVYNAVNIRWSGDTKWKRIVQGDGRGYYAFLPALFIYQDFNYHFYDSVESKKFDKSLYKYVRIAQGKRVDKYFVGVSVLQMPFFLMAHASSAIFHKPMDGYSKLYFKFMHLSGIFYFMIGLIFLVKILLFYKIKIPNIMVTITVIVFGTNLLYYGVYENSLSHIYSFGLINFWIYTLIRLIDRPQPKKILLLGVLLAFIVLIRPINGLLIFSIPFFAGSWVKVQWLFKYVFQEWKWTVPTFLLALFILSIQLGVYYLSTGHLFVDSYGDSEGLILSNPHFFKFLISYKKGLFLYTPIYLVSLFGTLFIFKENKFKFLAYFIFLIGLIYVLSSWHCWWYGGSFSSRVMVDYLAFFALPLAFLVDKPKSLSLRIIIFAILVLLTAFCIFQTYQYYYGYIHWSLMDHDRYWKVFLKGKI